MQLESRGLEKASRWLASHRKLPKRVCFSFVQGAQFVAIGVRGAYLADTLTLELDDLQAVLIGLRTCDACFNNVRLFHEIFTGQTFVVRKTAANVFQLRPDPVYVNPETNITIELDDLPEALSRIITDLQECDTDICVLDVRGYTSGDVEAQNLMVAVAGWLLEYPFVYLPQVRNTAGQTGESLQNVNVAVIAYHLSLLADSEDKLVLLQCSVPETVLEKTPSWRAHLEAYRAAMSRRAEAAVHGASVSMDIKRNCYFDRLAL